MISVSKEDYLKAVSEAEAEGQIVIAATLAHWLSVTRPAVATALKRLKKDGLVIVKSDGRIQLFWRSADCGANYLSTPPD